MLTYASYFTKDNNILATSDKVALSDALVSILAGIAIFPVVFSFPGIKPGMGPGLLFQTIPLVFSKIPLGNILLVAFFFLTSIAATTAMISMVEVPVAYFSEERGMNRTTAVLLTSSITIIIGVPTVHPKSILENIKVFGFGFSDFFDKTSSNILLPAGGLLIAVFVGYIVKKSELRNELLNNCNIKNEALFNIFYFILRYVTPLLLIIVFLHSVGAF